MLLLHRLSHTFDVVTTAAAGDGARIGQQIARLAVTPGGPVEHAPRRPVLRHARRLQQCVSEEVRGSNCNKTCLKTVFRNIVPQIQKITNSKSVFTYFLATGVQCF